MSCNRLHYISALLILFMMWGCGKGDQGPDLANMGFTEGLEWYYSGYEELSDHLVNDRADEASLTARKLEGKASKLNWKHAQISGEASTADLAEILDNAMEAIALSRELDRQREAFELVSIQLSGLLELNGGISSRVFIHYCPLAFDNEGAVWLSSSSTIANPYNGRGMADCGTTKQILPPLPASEMVSE